MPTPCLVRSSHQIGQWTSTIVENCLKELSALNKPFKYVGKAEAPETPREECQRRYLPGSTLCRAQ